MNNISNITLYIFGGILVIGLLWVGVRLLRAIVGFIQDFIFTPIGNTYYRVTYPERYRTAINNPHRNIDTTRLPPIGPAATAAEKAERDAQNRAQLERTRIEYQQYVLNAEDAQYQYADEANTRSINQPNHDPPIGSDQEPSPPSRKVEFEKPPTPEEREQAWDELILPDNTKRELRIIETLLVDPELFQRDWGRNLDFKGALLTGPPGTGKTSIAKALAKSAGYSFFTLDPATVKAKWVGESEKVVAGLYKEARENAPSIVFLDEIDAFASQRSNTDGDSGGAVKAANSLVNQLLQEIDGFNSEGASVFTIAATNRPDTLDAALRSRLNYNIEVPLPTPEARAKILHLHMGSYVELGRMTQEMKESLIERTEGMSGRDLKNLATAIPLTTLAQEKQNADEEVLDHAFERIRTAPESEYTYQ